MCPQFSRWLCTLALLLPAGAAMAHPTVENTLDLRVDGSGVVLDLQVTLEEILVAQAVKPAPDGGYDPAALDTAAQRHRAYLATHLFLEAAGQPLALQVTRLIPPVTFSTPHATLYQYRIVAPRAGS